jgi:chromosome segregation ATPase
MAVPNHETTECCQENLPGYAGSTSDMSPETGMADAREIELLQLENRELRERAASLEQLFNELSQSQETLTEQQADYEKCLEEKSDTIRELHLKVQELQSRPPAASPREEELLALSEELEQERAQIKADEEALMQQMSAMELQMSRERAEIARQRNELHRLQNDIQFELERAAREASLRDRLVPLQRRHQEIIQRRGAEPPREPARQAVATTPISEESPPKDSGLFRRLFGQGGK